MKIGPAVIGYSLLRSPSRGHVPTVFHYVRLFLSCHVMCCFIGKVYKLKKKKLKSKNRTSRCRIASGVSGPLVLDAGSFRSLGNPYPIGDDLPRHYARLPLAAAQPLASMRPKFDV